MKTTLRVRRPVIGVIVILLFTGAFSAVRGQEPARPEPPARSPIMELLQQRRAVLSELVKVQTAAYRQGDTDVRGVIEAHQQLLVAELALAADHDERISLLEKSVGLANDLERIVRAKYKDGHASVVEVLTSQAETLEVNIDLLRERQGTQKD